MINARNFKRSIVSEAQRRAMQKAFNAKMGRIDPSTLEGSARRIFENVSGADLSILLDEAVGKRLPERVKKKRKGSDYGKK